MPFLPDVVAHTLIPGLNRQRQIDLDLSEFSLSLVYTVSSTTLLPPRPFPTKERTFPVATLFRSP